MTRKFFILIIAGILFAACGKKNDAANEVSSEQADSRHMDRERD